MQFTKATKKAAKLRMALIGPSGSGKTYSALEIGKHLGAKVALIDTEHSSASKYADLFEFDTLNLETFGPQQYIDAIHAARGYDVLIIDSLSHAWMGVGGALDQVDKAAARNKGNSYTAWRDVTPQHNALVQAILSAPMHIIATMRAKTEYVVEKDERGKSVPRKIGMAPIQRDGMEYEFDVTADMDLSNKFIVSKSRCPKLHEAVVTKPGKNVADILNAWLSDGAPATPGLVKTLAASVDDAWPKWLYGFTSRMVAAKTMGELGEVWADAMDSVKKLTPPTEFVDKLTAAKNEAKAALQAQSAAE